MPTLNTCNIYYILFRPFTIFSLHFIKCSDPNGHKIRVKKYIKIVFSPLCKSWLYTNTTRLLVFNYDHSYPSLHIFCLTKFILPRKSLKKKSMTKKHLLSSISMQSDNRWKGNFKKKERNLGSLAAPISSVLSNNKIDF